jgi:hypothetical protein
MCLECFATICIRQHTSAYVSIRNKKTCALNALQQPAYVSIRQHTSAYVSIHQHTSAYVSIRQHTSAYVSIRQHTSAHVSIRQHTSAYVSIRQHTYAYLAFEAVHAVHSDSLVVATREIHRRWLKTLVRQQRRHHLHTSAYVSIRQYTSACVCWQKTLVRQQRRHHLHTSAYVSIREHASAYVSIREHT